MTSRPLPQPSLQGRFWRWLTTPAYSVAHLLAGAALVCVAFAVPPSLGWWLGWPLVLAALFALAAVALARRRKGRP